MGYGFMASEEALNRAMSENARLQGKLAKISEHGEKMFEGAIQIAEVGGAALALSYANARYGNSTDGKSLQVLGVDVDLLGAVAFHAAGWLGAAGKYDDHMHNLGNGALASYLARLGTDLGLKAKAGTTPTGQMHTAGGFLGTGQNRNYFGETYEVRRAA